MSATIATSLTALSSATAANGDFVTRYGTPMCRRFLEQHPEVSGMFAATLPEEGRARLGDTTFSGVVVKYCDAQNALSLARRAPRRVDDCDYFRQKAPPTLTKVREEEGWRTRGVAQFLAIGSLIMMGAVVGAMGEGVVLGGTSPFPFIAGAAIGAFGAAALVAKKMIGTPFKNLVPIAVPAAVAFISASHTTEGVHFSHSIANPLILFPVTLVASAVVGIRNQRRELRELHARRLREHGYHVKAIGDARKEVNAWAALKASYGFYLDDPAAVFKANPGLEVEFIEGVVLPDLARSAQTAAAERDEAALNAAVLAEIAAAHGPVGEAYEARLAELRGGGQG